MFNQPYPSRSALKAPPTLSVATDTLASKEKNESLSSEGPPRTRPQFIPIPDTPTIMMPGYTEQSIRRPSYTYSASNQFSTSEASTMLDSLFDSSEIEDSWTPDSHWDSSLPSEAMSWSSSSITDDTVESSFSKENDVFSMNTAQASASSSNMQHAEKESQDSTFEAVCDSSSLPTTSITPSDMHLAPDNLMQPAPVQPTPLLASWLDQVLVEQSTDFADPLFHRRTNSESPMTASKAHVLQSHGYTNSFLPSMSAFSPSNHTSAPIERSSTVPDLAQVFAQVQFAASSTSSSPVIKTEENIFPSTYHLSSPLFNLDDTPSPACSTLSLPTRVYNESVAPARAQFGTTNSLSDLSNWKFVPSLPQLSRRPSSTCSSDTSIDSHKKRRADGIVTDTNHSRRKGAKSFRRFSCLSKEVNVNNNSCDGKKTEEVVKSDQQGAEKASMSYTISQDIILKPRPSASERVEEEQVDYPQDLELYQQCLQARAPPPSSNNDDPRIVETNVGVMERSRAGEMDIYTPRWSRGAHRERDGWCHLCKQGGWYSMKRSQYLYHLQYDHGVSSQTKKVFAPPKALRIWNDAVESTEGLCVCCNKWIPICFGPVRKRNFKVYFKHVHACQRRNNVA